MSKSKAPAVKPGQKVKVSGQYGTFSPSGKRIGKDEVTLVKGKPAPPTKSPGQRHKLVDETK